MWYVNTVNFSRMENIQVSQQKLCCFFKIADHYMSKHGKWKGFGYIPT